MRVLHTADWHLGQRFRGGQERTEEHKCFLDWLLEVIVRERVDVLVVAGDVFDTGYPPTAAQQQYFRFLADLCRQGVCQDVVIVGGNHDSAALLNASAQLLRHFRVHVVGGVPAQVEEQCLPLPHGAAEPRLVVAAVPFLRDGDVRRSVAGESTEEREARLRDGIAGHYRAVAECVAGWRERGVPVLATGHLFAAGCLESVDSERPIHVGTLGQITAAAFPAAFDYVALGHLHRPQRVGGTGHIRYSGSPIPLSFAEAGYRQQVLLLDFGREPGYPAVRELAVPCRRQLLRVSGTLEEVLARLDVFEKGEEELPAWVEVQFESGDTNAACLDRLRAVAAAKREHLRVVGVPRHLRLGTIDAEGVVLEDAEPMPQLDELKPVDVFDLLLDLHQFVPDTEPRDRLRGTFAELLRRVEGG